MTSSARSIASAVAAVGVVTSVLLRPDAPTPGSDCEALSPGLLGEPVAALSALALIAAGWFAAHRRPIAGGAVIMAGATSFAAHATSHPAARTLDGIVAVIAAAVMIRSLIGNRPPARDLLVGIGIMASATLIWILTRTDGILCDAVGPWGHAAWHVLVAAAVVTVSRPVPASRTKP